jgi:hypothetical protein
VFGFGESDALLARAYVELSTTRHCHYGYLLVGSPFAVVVCDCYFFGMVGCAARDTVTVSGDFDG